MALRGLQSWTPAGEGLSVRVQGVSVNEPTYVAETLAWCNARREEFGKRPLKKLPKGARKDGESCPCGKATGLHVTSYSYGLLGFVNDITPRKIGDLPEPVARFVRAFDDGYLPQYEDES